MKRVYGFLLVCLAVPSFLFGVPATPELVTRVLPDGSTELVYMRGDEHAHYLTDIDGKYIENSYVGPSETTYTDRMLAPAQTLLSSYMPSKGVVHIPVILVNYTDLAFTMDNHVAKFDDMFNRNGGTNPNATGSVANYFSASSHGQLQLVFHVYGPYTLSHEMAYYGATYSGGHDKNPRALVAEAAELAAKDGVDFATFDNNNDGFVDNISIITAGYNEAEGGDANTIWPHYSTAGSTTAFNGKHLSGYLIITEYRGNTGRTQAGIGTYCHEFGHALGLPDLYNTKDGDKYTVGTWDIMCSGSYNNYGCTPPSYTAFERFAMGWLLPEQLASPSTYQLEPIETGNKAYLLAKTTHNMSFMSPDPSEYFLLENRQKEGWDANEGALVGTGMMISHITFSLNTWNFNTFNNSTPLGFAIVSAYISNPTQSTPSDLFPGPGNITTWLPTFNYGTTEEAQLISNIRVLEDGTVRFRYGTRSDVGFSCYPTTLSDLVTTYDLGIYEYFEDSVQVTYKGITADTVRISTSSSYFEYSIDHGATWQDYRQQQSLPVRNHQLDSLMLYVRYVPNRQECNSRAGVINITTDDHQYDELLQVRGASPRPTYINPPVILQATDISSTSFRANWEAEEDAEFYYATLYFLEDTPSEYTQDFDTFGSESGISDAGWSANFVRTTTQVVARPGKAVLFSSTGEHLTSHTFPLPPSEIRCWLSNNYTVTAGSSTIGGTLRLEGRSVQGEWKLIETMTITGATKNLAKTFSLPPEEEFVQFRFSYAHIGGNGGVAIDDFAADMDKTRNYICQGTEREIPGNTTSAIFSNLTSGTTYYFSVSAYEYKGCEEHHTSLSPVQAITTLSNIDNNAPWTIMRSEDGEYSVLLAEPSDGQHTLQIYSVQGKSVYSMRIPYGTTRLVIPTASLTKGNLYILKHIENKLRRNTSYGKMLYY